MQTNKLVLLGLTALVVCSAAQAQASPAGKVNLQIEGLPVDRAIRAWCEQTGYQALFAAGDTFGHAVSPVVKGRYTPEDGLRTLLASTDLEYQFVNARTVAIRIAGVSSESRVVPDRVANGKPSFRAQQEAGGGSTPANNGGALDVVVVTAQKREERLQDVPVPVSVISADSLAASNQTGLQDYYNKLPGLTMASFLGGTPAVVIRGVTSGGFNNPTVGITIDDAPYGASTSAGGGYIAIDLDASDLARIEVLRGPQGTLYGASSMGGLLKYVAVDPSTERVSGNLQVGLDGVRNGDGTGNSIRGAINVPLGEDLAVRMSAYRRDRSGYIDNPSHGLEGINDGTGYGGRVSFLWRPWESASLKLTAMHQYNDLNGANEADVLATGDTLEQASYVPGGGGSTTKATAAALTFNAPIGGSDLTLVSSYSDNYLQLRSIIPGLSAAANSFFGVTAAPYYSPIDTTKFSQEARISVPLGSRFDWLVGAFYTDEKSFVSEDINAADFTTGNVAGLLLRSARNVRYQEYAGFTNLTFHVTDKFDIQGGVRQSHIKIERTTALSGAFNNPPTVLPLRTADADAFTFLFSPRYKFSEELMVYGRIASGYRAGGPSANTQLAGVPPTFEPDRTINYELGMKGSTLEGALGFDVSAYYIDWRDIQLRQVLGTFGFVSNGGKAKSEGIEVSIDARPWTGMSLDTWVAWNDATLTESLPSGPGLPRGDDGERLPYSARISAGLNATQRFPVRGSLTAFAGFSLNYVGDRISDFSPVAARLRLAPYAKTDVQFGLESAAWRFNAFVNNVADRRGRIAVSFVTPNTFTIIQPRTYGVSVQRNF